MKIAKVAGASPANVKNFSAEKTVEQLLEVIEKFIESPGHGPREESLRYLEGKIQSDRKLNSAKSPEAFLQAGAKICNVMNKNGHTLDAIMLWTILNPEELRLKNAPPSERHLDFHRSLEGKNRGDEF